MTPITKITLRRLRKNRKKSIFLMVAVLFSMLMITFFVFFWLQTVDKSQSIYHGLPFIKFLDRFRLCLGITALLLLAVTLLTVKTHCDLRNRENEQILAVLTSVGATAHQKRRLMLIEAILLYLPPTSIGVCLGILPGIVMGNLFMGKVGMPIHSLLLYPTVAVGLVTVSMLLIMLCCFLPDVHLKRHSVIRSVRKQNTEAGAQTHGYRQSKTFQSQSFTRRLAKKSTDYYAQTYRSIALSLASAAMYPVTAILLFKNTVNVDVTLDVNPYDIIDTAADVYAAVRQIFGLIGVCFIILTCVGIVQAFMMARMQYMARKQSARVYLSIGMPESDIRRMIFSEIASVLLRTLAYLSIWCIFALVCFMLATG